MIHYAGPPPVAHVRQVGLGAHVQGLRNPPQSPRRLLSEQCGQANLLRSFLKEMDKGSIWIQLTFNHKLWYSFQTSLHAESTGFRRASI
jgi:hypothetical protein